ncbi:pectate lyase superfamily protein-domain-containing protein [Coniochaeta sp. 2T2.1]|nr:pectate lyase superfamily protein-domain-containing protein [Coniochaeta sp. 2T2.1]
MGMVPRTSQTRSTSAGSVAPLLKRVTASALETALSIVQKAIAESAERNEARYKSPQRNKYRLRPGTVVGPTIVERRSGQNFRARGDSNSAAPVPLLEITEEIANAAALVAEADAMAAAGIFPNMTTTGNSTLTGRQTSSGTFWMASTARRGIVPWGDNSTYAVFRNVRDYGATENGVTDDTAAIKRAMMDGKRCGEKCHGSTIKNAIVYFPPGTYLVSTSIPLPFVTQVIGDANTRPLLKAAPGFVGLGVLSTDEYTGGGTGADGLDQQYYINTANFYRQLRNIVIDVRATAPAQKIACLHYQVAQATSLQNVELISGPDQTGMFAEIGSGGHISDVTFTGGAYGIYGGNQQFTAQCLQFGGCTIGVQVIWDWGWVWKSVVMTNVGTGFKLVPDAGQTGNIGSVSILDSTFTNVGTVVIIRPPSSTPGSGTTGLILENVALSGVAKAIADTSGATLLAGGTIKVDHWALGPVYAGSTTARTFSTGAKIGNYRRSSVLINDNGAYFERAKPQYEDVLVSSFLHVREFGAKGDGSNDDTAAFQQALYASQGKILFVDAGAYILTSTITVPSGSKIVGETWSQLAGAVLIEWNIRASAKGSAGLWDCHVRVGGAKGTDLTPNECPALTSGVAQGCNAASLMMHITPSASGYFENMWLWVADHDIEYVDVGFFFTIRVSVECSVVNSVYVARGFLIESRQATWLYGTACEHAVFYQYNFEKAKNVFGGMIQTESPYYRPTPPPPAPFTSAVGLFPGDPTYTCAPGNEFSGCDESWGVFSTYTQECIDPRTCQKALLLLDNNSASVRIQHLITIGAKYMAVMNGQGIAAVANANVGSHPFWSQISVLDVTSSSGSQFNDLIWIDPAIWYMSQPEFTCIPPCHVQLPPWTGATSTVNYPLLTVSAGTWTSTITRAPLTISQWIFEVVTITQGAGGNNKRQDFNDFYPKLATTPHWPAVVYRGPNGSPTTLAPSVTYPQPTMTIGPDATPPPKGGWPARPVRPRAGLVNSPVVEECAFQDYKCQSDPNNYGDGSLTTPEDEDEDDYDENEDLATETDCGTTTSRPVYVPAPSPPVLPDPEHNKVVCYNYGQAAKHWETDMVSSVFCGDFDEYAKWSNGHVSEEGFAYGKTLYSDPMKSAPIDVQIILEKGCTWNIGPGDCERYLRVPIDACDSGGVDGKHGGVVRNSCISARVDPNVRWL